MSTPPVEPQSTQETENLPAVVQDTEMADAPESQPSFNTPGDELMNQFDELPAAPPMAQIPSPVRMSRSPSRDSYLSASSELVSTGTSGNTEEADLI